MVVEQGAAALLRAAPDDVFGRIGGFLVDGAVAVARALDGRVIRPLGTPSVKSPPPLGTNAGGGRAFRAERRRGEDAAMWRG